MFVHSQALTVSATVGTMDRWRWEWPWLTCVSAVTASHAIRFHDGLIMIDIHNWLNF
jgi:hypothetical protein